MKIKISADLLDGMVLALLAQNDYYGYALTQDMQAAIEISESTMYPVLRRLQKKGFLTTYDQPFQGRNRRYYQITEEGSKHLAAIKEIWSNYKYSLDQIFLGEERKNKVESEQYLRELVDFLSNLNDADKQDAVAYYSEYIADAGLVSRQQIVDKLGTPKHLAFRIMADYSVKEDRLNDNKMKTVRSNSKMIGLIIMAVLSAPMTLGIGAVILLGLLCMIISIVVFVIGLFGGLIIGGVTSFYFGLTNILKNFYTGIFYFGTGFVISGLLLILWPIIYWMSKEILQVVANLVSYLYQKFRNRQRKDTKL